MSESKDMVVLIQLDLRWIAYTSLNSHVLDQLLYQLNPRLKTYNQTYFDTEFANTKNLALYDALSAENIFLWLQHKK
jgi:hypothetical protein